MKCEPEFSGIRENQEQRLLHQGSGAESLPSGPKPSPEDGTARGCGQASTCPAATDVCWDEGRINPVSRSKSLVFFYMETRGTKVKTQAATRS